MRSFVRYWLGFGLGGISFVFSGALRAETVPPNAVTNLRAYPAGVSNQVRLTWTTPGNDGVSGDLQGGSSYFIQYATQSPSSVAWSTASAQIVFSTAGVPSGVTVSTRVALGLNRTYFFHMWTSDESGNLSEQDVTASTASSHNSPFSFEIVEGPTPNAGGRPRIAVDGEDNLHLVYRNSTASTLRYAKRTGAVWGSPLSPDTEAFRGTDASLALDGGDVPRFIHYDLLRQALVYTRLTGSSWASVQADGGEGADVGEKSSLALDGAGRVHVSYYNDSADDLKYALFDGVSWSTATIDAAGDEGSFNGIAVDGAGRPHIIYALASPVALKYARFDGSAWSTTTVESGAGNYCSLALDADGRPRAAYNFNGTTLRYAAYNGAAWSITDVDSAGFTGYYTSIALDGAGHPHIVYGDNSASGLKYARFDGTSWSTATVDADGIVWTVTSVALDGQGGVHIGYSDIGAGVVKAAHWENAGFPAPMGGNAQGRAQAPSRVTATALGISSIAWTWADNSSNELGFRVYTATSSGVFNILADTSALNTNTWDQTGLLTNTSYQIYVAAVNAGGVAISSAGVGFTAAQTPAGTLVSSATQDTVSLNWSPNGNPEPGTTYEVWRATDDLFTSPTLVSVATSGHTAADLVPQTTYYFQVRALNGAAVATVFDAAVGTVTAVSPDNTPPAAVTGVTAVWANVPDNITLSWVSPGDDGSTGALPAGSAYRVQYATGDPAAVSWSTANAQVVISTHGVAPGVRVSTTLSVITDQINYFRVWARDEKDANDSPASSTASAYANPFSHEVVDSEGTDVSALAVDEDGALHALYARSTALYYSKRAGAAWSAPSFIDTGEGKSLAVDADGHVHVAYYGGANDLKYAFFNGISWSTATLDDSGEKAGDYASMAVDAGGQPRIAYHYRHDINDGGLRFAQLNGGLWSIATVQWDFANDLVGLEPSLALDPAGHPHIAYFPDRYARWTGAAWAIESGTGMEEEPSLVLDGDGYPRIGSFTEFLGLGWLLYSQKTAAGWAGQSVDPPGGGSSENIGPSVSLSLDGAGRPQMAYLNQTTDELKFARHNGSAWAFAAINLTGDTVNRAVSVLGGDGQPYILYHAANGDEVKLAYWSGADFPRPMGGDPRSRGQAPDGLSATILSPTQVQYDWTDNAANEQGFRLYGGSSAAGPFSLISSTSVIGADQTSYTENSLQQDVTYYRYVAGINAGGIAVSNRVSFSLSGPAAPGNFTADALGVSSITWTWDDVSGESGYRVLSSTDGNLSGDLPPGTLSWTETDLSTNASYARRVAAFNAGGVSSSAAVSLYTLAAPPAGSAWQAVAVSSLTFSWALGGNPVGTTFVAQISTDNFSTLLASSQTVALQSVFSGLNANTTYYARVRAANGEGEATAYDSTLAATSTLVAAPLPLSPAGVSAGQVTARWDPNDNGPGTLYEAQVSTDNFDSVTASSQTVVSSATFSGLLTYTTYYFQVRARGNDGAWASFVTLPSTITLPVAPTAPAAPMGEALGVSSITWTWEDGSDETGYRVVDGDGVSLSGNLAAGSVAWTETGLSTNTAYNRSVVAFNSLWTSTSTAGEKYTAAARPAVFSFSAVHTSSISLVWSADNPAGTVYRLGFSLQGAAVQTLTMTSSSCIVTGLTSGAAYDFQLQALNGEGESTASLLLSTVTASAATISTLVDPSQPVTLTFPQAAGETRLQIPARTFEQPVTVTLAAPASFPSALGLSPTGMGVEVEVEGGLQPRREVLLSLAYDPDLLASIDERTLVLARYDASTAAWLRLSSVVDRAARRVLGRADHFSLFQIMGSAPASGLSAARAFPNPLDLSQGQSEVNFSNLPVPATLKIYSSAGRLVRELTAGPAGMALWDARNESGEMVATGIYFVAIKSAGSRTVLKVAVIKK